MGRRRRWSVAIAAGVVAIGVLALHLAHRGRPLPRVSVGATDVGGLSAGRLRAAVAAVAGRREAMPVTLVAPGWRSTARAAELGAVVDAEATAGRALRAGRGNLALALYNDVSSTWRRRRVEPVTRVDGGRLAGYLRSAGGALERAPDIGAIRADPATLTVSSRAPHPGRRVDRGRLAARLARAVAAGARTVPVPLRRVAPPDTARDVARVAAEARRSLAGALRLTAGSASTTLSPRRIAPLLRLEPAPGGRGARLGADPAGVRDALDALAAALDRPARQTEIAVPAATPLLDTKTDTSFRARRVDVRVRSGRAGQELDRARARRALDALLAAGRGAGRLPVSTRPPRIAVAAARRIDSLIGTFTTLFPCCQPRVRNIRRIAEIVDGTVIAPGAQFSLNGVAGRRTRARGFVPAPFIANNRLVQSVGGGVSQFATTTYNAVFFSGLRIDRHTPHSEYISRYPPGREATVDYPSLDLLWTDDTPAPVVVRSSSTPTSVTVSLYGQDLGRRVRAVTTDRRPLAGGDFQITVQRVVRYRDGRVRRASYTTSYRPLGA